MSVFRFLSRLTNHFQLRLQKWPCFIKVLTWGWNRNPLQQPFSFSLVQIPSSGEGRHRAGEEGQGRSREPCTSSSGNAEIRQRRQSARRSRKAAAHEVHADVLRGLQVNNTLTSNNQMLKVLFQITSLILFQQKHSQ